MGLSACEILAFNLPNIATGLFPTKSGNPFRSGEWVLGIKLVKK
jgi:hypothetical protein